MRMESGIVFSSIPFSYRVLYFPLLNAQNLVFEMSIGECISTVISSQTISNHRIPHIELCFVHFPLLRKLFFFCNVKCAVALFHCTTLQFSALDGSGDDRWRGSTATWTETAIESSSASLMAF